MKRRTFLHRIGSILAAVGIAEADWFSLPARYQYALAQPNQRKLALLVGINQYPQYNTPLIGCLTDVELQRELLIHRFGFQPSDILTLTDQEATREVIETAFLEHLVKSASSGDVVFFHFSGYGSTISFGAADTLQNVLLPSNSNWQDKKNVNYLLEETLLLLLRSLNTDRTIAVLDTSYNLSSSLQPIGLRTRARKMPEEVLINEAELEFQKQLQSKPGNLLNSLVLSATNDIEQVAREVVFSGFSAGLFTYALTQYLWEVIPARTIQVSLEGVGSRVILLGGKQLPALSGDKRNQQKASFSYNLLPESNISAEGAVTLVEEEGKTAQLHLAGLPPQVLEYFGTNSRLNLVPIPSAQISNNTGEVMIDSMGDAIRDVINRVSTNSLPDLVNKVSTNSPSQVKSSASQAKSTPLPQLPQLPQLIVRSRSGLTAKAQFGNLDSTVELKVGQLVQEAVRVLPRNINLTIALDTGLSRIERVDATSAFSTVPHVSSGIVGEQNADYLFGKLWEESSLATGTVVVTPSIHYGLFSLSSELIPNTTSSSGEAVKVAIQLLAPKLPSLVASKLWRLTENEFSSGLSVKACLEIIEDKSPRIIIERQTTRNRRFPTLYSQFPAPDSQVGTPQISIGSKIQYRVQNTGANPLYLMLLGLDSSKNAYALYPWKMEIEANSKESKQKLVDVVISPGETQVIPQTSAGMEWIVQAPKFWYESQLIFSTAPFSQTLATLGVTKNPAAQKHRISPLLNPVEVAQAVLEDLHEASVVTEISSISTDVYALDVNSWASFSFVYQVV
jgi:Caspase domain